MEFGPRDTVVIACLVLFIGKFLNRKIGFFREFNIPEPVTGGVLFSILFGAVYLAFGIKASFALELRDALLIVFFITIGLSSKLPTLLRGGRSLVVLLVLAIFYLFIQNFAGMGVATLAREKAITGILGGSVSFSGGHGTTIAWSPIFNNQYGLENAMELGIAFATIGLVLGGIIGGPIAKYLINSNDLKPKTDSPVTVGIRHEHPADVHISYDRALQMIFVIFLAAGIGILVKAIAESGGLSLPPFVTALFAAMIITNLIPVLFRRADWNPETSKSLALASDLSLGLFLAMSLMSLQLWTLSNLAAPLLLIIVAQVIIVTIFVIFVVFRFMGRDYDAAVISAGYAGLALGATPTAIANMTAVTKKFGGSPKAFIVVPLVGAFFIDISNALIISYLLKVFG